MSSDKDSKGLAISKFKGIENSLVSSKLSIQNVLPQGVDSINFINKVMSCFRKNPSLMKCTSESIIGAVIECATLNLVPDGITGLAHLVPFKTQSRGTECQLIIGYKGVRKLALRNPDYKKFVMRAVYEGDDFSYEFGVDEHLTHTPKGNSNKLTHVYAFVKTVDGDTIFDVMSKTEVDAAMKKSQKGANKNPVWDDHYDSMALKTVSNRLANKQLDLVVEAQRAFANDDLAMQGLEQKQNSNSDVEDDKTFFDEFKDVTEEEAENHNQEVKDKSDNADKEVESLIENKKGGSGNF